MHLVRVVPLLLALPACSVRLAELGDSDAFGKEEDEFGPEARSLWNTYAWGVADKYNTKGPGIQPACMPKLYEHTGREYRGAMLLLHGFTACPQQFEDLAQKLTAAGFVVLAPLNPGHGAAWKTKRSGKIRDFIRWMPKKVRSYRKFAEEMNSIMDQAGGETGLMGLSLGGSIAAYALQQRSYTRVLLANPVVRLGVFLNYLAGSVDSIAGLRSLRVSWGAGCEHERTLGRAGTCQFNAAVADAVADLGFRAYRRAKVLPEGSVQVIYTEKDQATSSRMVQKLAARLGAGKQSKFVCGWDEAVGHSWLSPYDTPSDNKYWLMEALNKTAEYLVDGQPLAQDGVHKSSRHWPRCHLKCTPALCRYPSEVTL